MTEIRTRFAPSPTGFMHIGGIRTALFAYLWAKKNNGVFMLRIEDTDKEREVPGSIEHIMESLKWLGIHWDFGPDTQNTFGPLKQSERLESYKTAALQLIEKGYAYPDPYTEDEIEMFRQTAIQNKTPFLFRNHRPDTFLKWDGTRPLRLKVPTIKKMQWHDEVRGDLEAGEEALDDFIIIKADGYPTYNFAHIVDDMHMGITHVMRGDEFISSTPKFLSVYEALGIERPKLVTLPPILNNDKTKKLGKRDGAKDILEYRSDGVLPSAMVNFLAFIGWNPGTEQEVFSMEELISAFDISNIQVHGGTANEEKLRWFNSEHIKRLDDEQLFTLLLPFIPKTITQHEQWQDVLKKLLPDIKQRFELLGDFATAAEAGEYEYFFTTPNIDPTILTPKKSTTEATHKHLSALYELCKSSEDYASADAVKSIVWEYAEEMGRGDVLWPFRVALSGREKSLDPFTIASILGKNEVLERLQRALDSMI